MWHTSKCVHLAMSGLALAATPAMAKTPDHSAHTKVPVAETPRVPDEIVVTASRADLLGKASTASQGSITAKEVALRPILRPGQLYESIPGLVVTIHSGEGKASQYLIRGFNLDHGTDFANFVDDMPVNRPTNTHGQGYSDLAYLIPETVSGIDYTKGPYFAAIGDFGSVASSHTLLANDLPNLISGTVGTDKSQRVFAAGTEYFAGDSKLTGGIEFGHFDGPWKPAENFKKVNAELRFTTGTAQDGFSMTGLYYKSAGLLNTDQPLRAIAAGLINRYGSLDPTDSSRSLRYSISAHLDKTIDDTGHIAVTVYGIRSTMTLWNNFTHYLYDQSNGDQEEQDESRNAFGGTGSFTQRINLGSIQSTMVAGLQLRYDAAFVDRRHSLHRTTILNYCDLPENDGSVFVYATVNSYCNADNVHLLDLAPYLQNTIKWTGWLRTVMGAREEYYHAIDASQVTGTGGSAHQDLFQPKGSLILGPWAKTEFYLSWGRGFHSNDVRGVFGTVPQQGIPLAAGGTPLLSATSGGEFGIRSDIVPKLTLQFSVFRQDFKSELEYNADRGQDQAGPPSRRQGVEVSAQYHPRRWLELNSDFAFAHARYRSADLVSFGFASNFIANAPGFIGSFGALVDDLGSWYGGLQWRRLGPYPINDGQRYPEDKGYSEFNLDLGHKLKHGWKVQASIFNLLNSHANASAYYYTARLPGEPAQGVADAQVHPLEPRAARLSVTKLF